MQLLRIVIYQSRLIRWLLNLNQSVDIDPYIHVYVGDIIVIVALL